MAVTKQQLAQWSREFAAKNPDKVSGAGSTAQNITTKKSSVTKEQLSQWSREFDKKEAQRQAEQEQNTRDKALQQYTERHISDMGEVDARNEPSQAASPTATENISGRKENLSPFPSADAARERNSPDRGNGDDRGQWPKPKYFQRKKILCLQFWKICGFSRTVFSRRGCDQKLHFLLICPDL